MCIPNLAIAQQPPQDGNRVIWYIHHVQSLPPPPRGMDRHPPVLYTHVVLAAFFPRADVHPHQRLAMPSLAGLGSRASERSSSRWQLEWLCSLPEQSSRFGSFLAPTPSPRELWFVEYFFKCPFTCTLRACVRERGWERAKGIWNKNKIRYRHLSVPPSSVRGPGPDLRRRRPIRMRSAGYFLRPPIACAHWLPASSRPVLCTAEKERVRGVRSRKT